MTRGSSCVGVTCCSTGPTCSSDRIGLPLAHWPASATGKGELPEAEPTWQAFHDVS